MLQVVSKATKPLNMKPAFLSFFLQRLLTDNQRVEGALCTKTNFKA